MMWSRSIAAAVLLGAISLPWPDPDLNPNIRVACETLYAPTATVVATDDIASLWRAPAAITISNIWCESVVSTITIDMRRDDGSPADVQTASLVCASTPVDACASGCTTTLVDAEDNFAAGDRMDLIIASVGTNPTTLNICWEYTYD